jgi:mannose-6-phosphate isomerase-like protein (cupin superfamily)
MSAQTHHDPVHGARHSFTPRGEDMTCDTWLDPKGGLPEHMHPRQEEHWSVIEGEIEIKLDGTWRTLRPEDGAVVVGPNHWHALRNQSGAVAHARCEVMPALGLEDFLTDSAAAARQGLFMKGGIPKSLRGARWAADFLERHREDVVMKFPPAPLQRLTIRLFGGRSGSLSRVSRPAA